MCIGFGKRSTTTPQRRASRHRTMRVGQVEAWGVEMQVRLAPSDVGWGRRCGRKWYDRRCEPFPLWLCPRLRCYFRVRAHGEGVQYRLARCVSAGVDAAAEALSSPVKLSNFPFDPQFGSPRAAPMEITCPRGVLGGGPTLPTAWNARMVQAFQSGDDHHYASFHAAMGMIQ